MQLGGGGRRIDSQHWSLWASVSPSGAMAWGHQISRCPSLQSKSSHSSQEMDRWTNKQHDRVSRNTRIYRRECSEVDDSLHVERGEIAGGAGWGAEYVGKTFWRGPCGTPLCQRNGTSDCVSSETTLALFSPRSNSQDWLRLFRPDRRKKSSRNMKPGGE